MSYGTSYGKSEQQEEEDEEEEEERTRERERERDNAATKRRNRGECDFRVFADAASVFVNVYGVPLDTSSRSRDTLIAFTSTRVRIFERFQLGLHRKSEIPSRHFIDGRNNERLSRNDVTPANYRGRLVGPTRNAKLPAYRHAPRVSPIPIVCSVSIIDQSAKWSESIALAVEHTCAVSEGEDASPEEYSARKRIRRNLLPGWPRKIATDGKCRF